MSSFRPVVWVILALAGTACAQEVKCPPYQGKNPLSSVSLFDGPPSEKADLMPDISRGSGDHGYASWDVGYLFDAGRSLFLVCRYMGLEQATIVKASKKVEHCVYRTHGSTKPAELSCK